MSETYKASYLKDGSNIISPAISSNTIYKDEKKYADLINYGSKFVYCGSVTVSSPTKNTFTVANLTKDFYIGNKTGNYFTVEEAGLYEINIYFRATNMAGRHSQRDLYIGASINNNAGDTSEGFWGTQGYDRYARNMVFVKRLNKGDTVKAKYYVDGDNFSLGYIQISIRQLDVNIFGGTNDTNSLTDIKAKYLLNEKGEVISPITSINTIGSGTCLLKDYLKNFVTPVLRISYRDLIFTTKSLTQNYKSAHTIGTTRMKKINSDFITLNGDTLSFTIKEPGWYTIKIAARMDDYANTADMWITDDTGGLGIVAAGRFISRRAMSCQRVVALSSSKTYNFSFNSDRNIGSLAWLSVEVECLQKLET